MLRFWRAVGVTALAWAVIGWGGQVEAAGPPDTFEARLVKYGRMPPAAAADLAGRLRGFLTGPLGPSETDPLETLMTALEVLPEAMLVSNCMLSYGRNHARGGFGLRVQDCDAYAAAILRRPSARHWRPIDKGEWLYAEMKALGLSDAEAKKAALSMASVIAYAPLWAENRDSGHLALILACPSPDTADVVQRLRAWHAGATRDMARCVAHAVEQLGPDEAGRLFMVDPGEGAAWARWAAASPP